MRLLLLVAVFTPTLLFGQILNDSTKLINGYRTTIYTSASDILSGNVVGHRLDTSLHNFHDTDEWIYIGNERQKNLGYISSPQQPLFLAYKTAIGRYFGLNTIGYLAFDPDSVRYFRSYNVYSKVKYNQGSYGRQWIQVEAAKNIASTFNVGFSLRRLTAQKQIGTTSRRERGSEHTAYVLHGNGSLFNNHYIILTSFSNMKQSITETGGIIVMPTVPEDSLFNFDISITQFPSNANTLIRQRNFRLHNILRIDTALPHLLISAGFNNDRYQFDLIRASNPNIQYSNFFLNGDVTNNDFQYEQIFLNPKLQETIGSVQVEVSYNLRRHRYANQGLLITQVNEQILSARAALTTRLGALQIEAASVPGRDKFIGARLNSNVFYALLSRSAMSPSFVAQNLVSNHFNWRNSFGLEQVLTAEAGLRLNTSLLQGSLGLKNQTIRNGIFYAQGKDISQDFSPYQEGSSVNNLIIKANSRLSIGTFSWELLAEGANPNRQDLLPQPRLFLRTVPAFTFTFKGGRYQVMPGIEAWYRSQFYGQLYDPSTNLFFLQSGSQQTQVAFPKSQPLNPYLWTALFVNLKINNTRGYIKLGNATQDIIGPGFFDVPLYPGQRRYFEFGIDWVFFD